MAKDITELSELHQFFVDLWDDREEKGYIRCFETGEWLSRKRYRENWSVYSHILPKKKYPQYEMKKWNIKIVHPNAHAQFEQFSEKAPKQYNLFKELVEKHKKGLL